MMKWVKDYRDGENISAVLYCKKADHLTTKAGKDYISLSLQDKSGGIDGKIWEVTSPGISDVSAGDFVNVSGHITTFQNHLQFNIDRIYVAEPGSYTISDYMPCTENNVEEMYTELKEILSQVKEPHLVQLWEHFFVDDKDFIRAFKNHSAAKSVHHGFIGGLLEHTLHVTKICQFLITLYPELNGDLLLTAAALHDIGKVYELSSFPQNDYTDAGQLLGHIVMGINIIDRQCQNIEGFPTTLRYELEHCIAAHHGELEYGSPKKPALMEALALHHADNTDAKLETFKEAVKNAKGTDWQGFNRFIDSNIRKTTDFSTKN